ncbi:MAG: hypothetical protein PHY93_18915 [Bacteriovorax sp.]|nr:hypothetical protein [Bacteriovorax sp.]
MFFELQQRFIFDWGRRFSHLEWGSTKRPLFPFPNGMLKPHPGGSLFQAISKNTQDSKVQTMIKIEETKRH